MTDELPSPRERIFNVPRVVLALVVLLAFIHLAVAFLLTEQQTNDLILWVAFSPLRYVATGPDDPLTGWGPKLWTLVSYAFFHVNVNHLVFNSVWLLAFGSPVARRFGAARFLAFFVATAAAGALAFLIARWGMPALMIGASAAVSGAMGAAIRFVFQRGGPLGMIGRADEQSFLVPAAPLTSMLRDPRILIFLVIWFGVNLIFGMGAVRLPGVEGTVAWEAHVGGFVAGLLGFALFDPIRPPAPENSPGPDDAPTGGP